MSLPCSWIEQVFRVGLIVNDFSNRMGGVASVLDADISFSGQKGAVAQLLGEKQRVVLHLYHHHRSASVYKSSTDRREPT
ncbi:hypothetical protein SCLCIDRAFT_1214953 [Scleroderma citrinum Foug A]|uniref:Uncharacterized protein n=1 Tax=Scleroderma citrinum Foug A TaxID=1036808 RepID=A0A0C3E2B1_9AGAM|nr:hypothetical protein SCLCIDRAFT_1214953 [Scleroderma citrinum Foug A]